MTNNAVAKEETHEATWKAQNKARIAVLNQGIVLTAKFAKLRANPIFKEVIEELYIKEEGANLVALIADPSTNSVDQQRSIQMRLGGISALQSYINQYEQAGATAKAEVAQLSAINTRLDQGVTVAVILAELEEVQG